MDYFKEAEKDHRRINDNMQKFLEGELKIPGLAESVNYDLPPRLAESILMTSNDEFFSDKPTRVKKWYTKLMAHLKIVKFW